MVGILSQVTTRQPCNIQINIILYNEAGWQMVRGKGWEHGFSSGKVLRGERSHRSSSTLRSSNNHIYSYTGDHYISRCEHGAYLKPRRPGERMGWINIPQKQWMSGGWVLIHEFSRTTSESKRGLVSGFGFVHRCRDNIIRCMKQCDGYIRLKRKRKKSVSQSLETNCSQFY